MGVIPSIFIAILWIVGRTALIIGLIWGVITAEEKLRVRFDPVYAQKQKEREAKWEQTRQHAASLRASKRENRRSKRKRDRNG